MDRESISRESHDYVKQRMFTVPDVSLEGDTRPELVYFIVRRVNILRSGEWCARLLSRIYLCSISLGGYEQRIQFGKVVFLVVWLVSYRRSNIQKLFPAV